MNTEAQTSWDAHYKRMGKADKLLPCPLCGSEGHQDSGFSPLESLFYAWCSNCDCPLNEGVSINMYPEVWNRRTPYPRAAFGGEATQAQVRVRDLVWDENVAALDIPCSYSFDGDDDDGWEVRTTWRTGTDDLEDGMKYPTLADARAAAQADFSARILAAIEVTP